jgi:hypothetical protein
MRKCGRLAAYYHNIVTIQACQKFRAAEWAAFLLRILEVSVSDLGRETDYIL